ncbi:MAG: hypothetical protein WC607_01400 [Candidatus Micrarchaeia archaeon]
MRSVKVYKRKRPAFDCRTAGSHWLKFKGIMLSSPQFKPLLFDFGARPNAIHSFFCPPFTAVWLDNRKRVLRVDRVAPWRIWVSCPNARYLIEAPSSNGVKAGDELSW